MAGARERGRRLPRQQRITRGSEIRALFRRGNRSRTPRLDVLYSDSPASCCRVGVVVPKHGHTAVRRNLLKRRLKEALRREILPRLEDATTVDVLVRARAEAYDASYGDFVDELTLWVERTWPASS